MVVQLPKISLLHGVVVLPRPVPVWVPVVVATGSLLALALTLSAVVSLIGTSGVASQTASYSPVVTQVMSYVNEWSPQRDPFVTLPGGVQAKASNVYGIEVNGERYYYQMTRDTSFDPLRAGKAGDYEVVAVIDAGTPWEVLVYRLR